MPLVVLDGVLNAQEHACDQDEWTFVLDIARGTHKATTISNIKIGKDVAGTKTQAASKARSLTCEHVTKKVTNFTVFFRWITPAGTGAPGSIRVIGYGKHAKNAKGGGQTAYTVQWSDGSRSPIELTDKAATGAAAFLATDIASVPR